MVAAKQRGDLVFVMLHSLAQPAKLRWGLARCYAGWIKAAEYEIPQPTA